MNSPGSDYLLLFRGDDWDRNLSPEDLQKVLTEIMEWFDSLKQRGYFKGGQPLGREGRTISGRNGTVTDGPFAESKEAVGGYLLVQVGDFDQAVAIAKSCPSLNYGITIEVRPVLEECPIFQRARERLFLATAW